MTARLSDGAGRAQQLAIPYGMLRGSGCWAWARVDPQRKIIEANHRFQELVAADPVGRSLGEVLGPLHAEAVDRILDQPLQDAVNVSVRLPGLAPQGEGEAQVWLVPEEGGSMTIAIDLGRRDGRRAAEGDRCAILDLEMARSARYGTPLSIALIHVGAAAWAASGKEENSARDRVVTEYLAALLSGDLRCTDAVCPLGGDIFLAVLSPASRSQAAVAAERIRHRMRGRTLPHHGAAARPSVAVAQWHPGECAADLLIRARRGLDKAIAAGGDRVEAVD